MLVFILECLDGVNMYSIIDYVNWGAKYNWEVGYND